MEDHSSSAFSTEDESDCQEDPTKTPTTEQLLPAPNNVQEPAGVNMAGGDVNEDEEEEDDEQDQPPATKKRKVMDEVAKEQQQCQSKNNKASEEEEQQQPSSSSVLTSALAQKGGNRGPKEGEDPKRIIESLQARLHETNSQA